MAGERNIEFSERKVAAGHLVVGLKRPTSIDFFNADDFANRLSEAVEKGEHRLVIDFTNITALSSKGLGALILLLNSVKQKNGVLRLFNLNDRVRETFKITRMDALFDILPDEASAITP